MTTQALEELELVLTRTSRVIEARGLPDDAWRVSPRAIRLRKDLERLQQCLEDTTVVPPASATSSRRAGLIATMAVLLIVLLHATLVWGLAPWWFGATCAAYSPSPAQHLPSAQSEDAGGYGPSPPEDVSEEARVPPRDDRNRKGGGVVGRSETGAEERLVEVPWKGQLEDQDGDLLAVRRKPETDDDASSWGCYAGEDTERATGSSIPPSDVLHEVAEALKESSFEMLLLYPALEDAARQERSAAADLRVAQREIGDLSMADWRASLEGKSPQNDPDPKAKAAHLEETKRVMTGLIRTRANAREAEAETLHVERLLHDADVWHKSVMDRFENELRTMLRARGSWPAGLPPGQGMASAASPPDLIDEEDGDDGLGVDRTGDQRGTYPHSRGAVLRVVAEEDPGLGFTSLFDAITAAQPGSVIKVSAGQWTLENPLDVLSSASAGAGSRGAAAVIIDKSVDIVADDGLGADDVAVMASSSDDGMGGADDSWFEIVGGAEVRFANMSLEGPARSPDQHAAAYAVEPSPAFARVRDGGLWVEGCYARLAGEILVYGGADLVVRSSILARAEGSAVAVDVAAGYVLIASTRIYGCGLGAGGGRLLVGGAAQRRLHEARGEEDGSATAVRKATAGGATEEGDVRDPRHTLQHDGNGAHGYGSPTNTPPPMDPFLLRGEAGAVELRMFDSETAGGIPTVHIMILDSIIELNFGLAISYRVAGALAEQLRDRDEEEAQRDDSKPITAGTAAPRTDDTIEADSDALYEDSFQLHANTVRRNGLALSVDADPLGGASITGDSRCGAVATRNTWNRGVSERHGGPHGRFKGRQTETTASTRPVDAGPDAGPGRRTIGLLEDEDEDSTTVDTAVRGSTEEVDHEYEVDDRSGSLFADF